MTHRKHMYRGSMGTMLLVALSLSGCGLMGGSDEPANEAKAEENRLLRTLRAARAAKETFDGKDAAQAGANAGQQGEQEVEPARALGSVLEALAGAQGETGEEVSLEALGPMFEQLGDSEQFASVLGGMMESMAGSGAAGPAVPAPAAPVQTSEAMRGLDGVAIRSTRLNREQARALLIPQSMEDAP